MTTKSHKPGGINVKADPVRGTFRPNEPFELVLRINGTDEIGAVFEFPDDIKPLQSAYVFREGTLKVKLIAALPGRYVVKLKSLSVGAGNYSISVGHAIILGDRPCPIATFDIRWGGPTTGPGGPDG
jgi:hypothetical protein